MRSMNLLISFLLLILTSAASAAGADLCEILNLQNCSGVHKQGRRSSALSLPSPATASLLNPANVSFDRGLGLEAIAQAGNPVLFNIASGTGKMGAAVMSSSMENTFFANRIYEREGEYFQRNKEKKQYRNQKISLAIAAKLFGRRQFSLDGGLILKSHHEIKRINPGVGLSARLGLIHLGASLYQDDFVLTPLQYQERFQVQSYIA